MDLKNLTVFNLANQNMRYLSAKQRVIAANIAKNVLLSLIDIMGYEATPSDKTREYTWLDEKYKYVPSVVGMDLDSAKKMLKGFKIEYAGTGAKVSYQEPQNRWVKETGIVKLYLEE